MPGEAREEGGPSSGGDVARRERQQQQQHPGGRCASELRPVPARSAWDPTGNKSLPLSEVVRN